MLKLGDDAKTMIEDISAISGINSVTIKEVWEMTAFCWIEKMLKSPRGRNNLMIPFLGNVGVKYEGDSENDNGSLSTEVSAFISLDSNFKSLIGDIVDENYKSVVDDILKKKMGQVIETVISPSESN